MDDGKKYFIRRIGQIKTEPVPPGTFGSTILNSPPSHIPSPIEILEKITGAEPSGLQFTVQVSGLPPSKFAVVEFSLDEAFSTPWRLDLNVTSKDPAVAFAAVLDRYAIFCIWQDGVMQRQVEGIIAAFEQGDTGLHQTRYSLVVRPLLWRTSQCCNSRIFQRQTPEDIIRTLLRERGVVFVNFVLRYSHPAREFCVQYQESDFAFINRLSAEEGIYYYFDDIEQGGTLVFTDDVGPLSNGPSLPWNPSVQSSSRDKCISSFSRRVQVKPSSVSLKDYTFKNPQWPAEFNASACEIHNKGSDYEYYSFPGRFKDELHGKAFARYQLEGLRNDADTGSAKSNVPELYPGLLFTLTSHPREELNRRWQIVSIVHRGVQPQALDNETGEQGTTYSNGFTFMPAHHTWRPEPLPKPRIDGSQIAQVVGPGTEEIYCDEYGRVRVRFPWDRYASGDDRSSCWIRVSQPWAGQGWGMIAIPRVGQEVVVDFLHGDPDQPIIIGRTYHASNMPAAKLPESKTQMVFRSKTHLGEGYNELKFDDANNNQKLSLRAQKDMSTLVLNNRSTRVEANHEEVIVKNQTIDVGMDQTTTVIKNQNVVVKEGDRNVTLEQGDEIKKIKTGKKSTEVQGSYKLIVNTDPCEIIRGSAKITLMDESISLTVGESSISLNKDGTIDIKGVKININGSTEVIIN